MRYALAALLAAVCVSAHGQYPERPVTLLVGFPPGGMVDLVARTLAESAKERFPRGLVVVNKAGAGGGIAAGEAVRAAPDGYTVSLTPLSALVIQPQLQKLSYRTPDDFTPVLNVVSFHSILVARGDAPWRTPLDVIQAARAKPGGLKVGTPGEATSPHLALEELKRLAGVDLVHVPYKGWGESSSALMGGHIELAIAQPGEIRALIEARRLHAIGAFQPGRSQTFPEVATWAEAGYPAFAATTFSVVAPKGLASEAARHLHDAFKGAMEQPAFAEGMKTRGIEVDYRSSDQMRGFLWEQYRAHTGMLRRLGMLKD